MTKIEIQLINGKWLINGKEYKDLTYVEKNFFDEFLVAIKLNFEAEKKQ